MKQVRCHAQEERFKKKHKVDTTASWRDGVIKAQGNKKGGGKKKKKQWSGGRGAKIQPKSSKEKKQGKGGREGEGEDWMAKRFNGRAFQWKIAGTVWQVRRFVDGLWCSWVTTRRWGRCTG